MAWADISVRTTCDYLTFGTPNVFELLYSKLTRPGKRGAKDVYIWGTVFGENLLTNAQKPGEYHSKGTKFEPTLVKFLQNRRVIKLGGADFCFCLAKDGALYRWGNLGRKKPISAPQEVKSLRGVHIVDIATSSYAKHVLALTSKGEVYGWGSNQFGQLCHASFDRNYKLFYYEPILLPFISKRKAKKIFVGGYDNFGMSGFITRDGNAFGCGSHHSGFLLNDYRNLDSNAVCAVPVFIEQKGIMQLCMGQKIVYILTEQGNVQKLVNAGMNVVSKCYNTHYDVSSEVESITIFSDIVQLSIFDNDLLLALLRKGDIHIYDFWNRTDVVYKREMLCLNSIKRVRSLTTGQFHGIAHTDDEVIAFGANNAGQVGGTKNEYLKNNICMPGKRIISSGCGAYYSYVLCE